MGTFDKPTIEHIIETIIVNQYPILFSEIKKGIYRPNETQAKTEADILLSQKSKLQIQRNELRFFHTGSNYVAKKAEIASKIDKINADILARSIKAKIDDDDLEIKTAKQKIIDEKDKTSSIETFVKMLTRIQLLDIDMKKFMRHVHIIFSSFILKSCISLFLCNVFVITSDISVDLA